MGTRRYKLNQNQLELLLLIYKFRFVSIPLLSKSRKISTVAVFNTLNILLDKKLVFRRYDKSYKFSGKPASFALSKQAILLLKTHPGLNDTYLHSLYKNPSLSSQFADQCIETYKTYLTLNQQYPDTFSIYTRAELVDYEDSYPEPLPDLVLKRKNSETTPEMYFLDLLKDSQLWLIKKRINTYIKHYESGDWEEETHPTVLFVCEDSNVEKKVLEYAEQAKDNAFIEDDELIIMTTTKKSLHADNKAVWSSQEKHLSSL